MSEHQMEHEYHAGAESPVSGVSHLFSSEQVSSDGPAKSLCGAVGSYGPFQPAEGLEGEACKNCERVREKREASEK